MLIDEERAGLISGAIGAAVVSLILHEIPISRDNIVEELERTSHEIDSVTGRGVNRAATEMVRMGR